MEVNGIRISPPDSKLQLCSSLYDFEVMQACPVMPGLVRFPVISAYLRLSP